MTDSLQPLLAVALWLLPLGIAAIRHTKHLMWVIALTVVMIPVLPYGWVLWIATLTLACVDKKAPLDRIPKRPDIGRTMLIGLLAIGLLVPTMPSAQAQDIKGFLGLRVYEPRGKHPLLPLWWRDYGLFKMESRVTFDLHRDDSCSGYIESCWKIRNVKWTRDRWNGIMRFVQWKNPINNSGIRDDGISWQSREIRAEFEWCLTYQDNFSCWGRTGHIKLVIRSTGTVSDDVWLTG